jgi:hypothetical protein
MLRYERKYYVSNDRLDDLRERLTTFVRPDDHSSATNGISQYTVRSIYYDTPTLTYYFEKMEGLENRSKYRIRVYDLYKPGDIAFLEIKRKLGNRIKKHRAIIPWDKVKKALETGNVHEHLVNKKELDDAKRFMYNYYRYSLRPLVLITYDREAYHGKFDSGVRITFDKNVRSTPYPLLSEIYSEEKAKLITPGHFILEIKYFNLFPTWARSLVEEFNVNHEAISKFSTGIDLHHQSSRFRISPVGLSKIGL